MNRRPASWTLSLIIGLWGCDQAPGDQPAAVCTQQQALSHDQGVNLNGVYGNAFILNGIAPNAISANGIAPNALIPNGIAPNGIAPNGIAPNGVAPNGIAPNGIAPNSVSLQGTSLRAVVGDRVIEEKAWVGATLTAALANGGSILLTITAVERDESDPDLTYFSLATPDGQNLCGGEGRGLFVAGSWDESGAHHDAPELISYSCMEGVIAKCVRWGYKPWVAGADMHQTCTRMARADYCGDGVPHTQNGTSIDVFDGRGIQTPGAKPGDGFTFEAGWGPGGAVCAARPRFLDHVADGSVALPSCWSRLPRCDGFEQAEAQGALIANASIPRQRLLCGQ